jgi:hypothetical protein
MSEKYIKQYTETTTPSDTDALLIDQGLGAYKYVQIANLLKGNTIIPISTTWRIRVDGTSCLLEYSTDSFATVSWASALGVAE